MTILQLKVAIATAETKSLTAASKQVNTTQPNASNCLKLLEKECGFPIFLRSSTGVVITPKGTQFLAYARQMLEMNEKIMDLRHGDTIYRLRLGTVNYYAAAEPFFTLLTEHRDNANNDFSYRNVSISEGIHALIYHSLDVVAVPVMKHQIVDLLRECQNAGIKMHSICQIPAIMMVRRNHPAEQDGRCANITQGCDVMKDYPYIGLRNLAEESGSIGYNDSDFIQCSYKMFADDTNARLRMIEATNGFGFGIQSSYRMMAQFALDYFPIPGFSLELFCLTFPGETEQRGVKDYLALLKAEMRRLLSL